jgi:hypothetical protein
VNEKARALESGLFLFATNAVLLSNASKEYADRTGVYPRKRKRGA